MRSSPVFRLLLALLASVLISCGGGGGESSSGAGSSSGGATPNTVLDVTPPSVPTGMRADGRTATSVSLSWGAANDDQGVAGYQIYRNGVLVSTVQGNLLNYIDTGLSAGTSYQYSVKALDAAGNLSDASASFLVSTAGQSTPDAQAPIAPASFILSTAGQTSLSMSWSPATDDVGIVAYQISRDGAVIAASWQVRTTSCQYRPAHRYPPTIPAGKRFQ
ncbi:MAG: fibronectin type III domain-containing protein [Uliginosibacterium sp.]|nr:fibronectin type III domain-containing protein [Uliginosibacterium sp.]